MGKNPKCKECNGTGEISLFNWTEGGCVVDCPYCEITTLRATIEAKDAEIKEIKGLLINEECDTTFWKERCGAKDKTFDEMTDKFVAIAEAESQRAHDWVEEHRFGASLEADDPVDALYEVLNGMDAQLAEAENTIEAKDVVHNSDMVLLKDSNERCMEAHRRADAAEARARKAAQIIIEEIGAHGPESVDETAVRAAVRIAALEQEIAELNNGWKQANDDLLTANLRLEKAGLEIVPAKIDFPVYDTIEDAVDALMAEREE